MTGAVRPLTVAIDVRCLSATRHDGIVRYTREIAAALAAQPGLRVVAIGREGASGLPVGIVAVGGRRELTWEQVALPRALARIGADVLLSPANRGLPLVRPCPAVLVLHDVAEWDRSVVPAFSGSAALRFSYANVVSLATATLILTGSRSSDDEIRARLGIGPGRIRVALYGVGEELRRDPGEAAIAGVRHRLGITSRTALHVGSLAARKDVPTLLRAVARVDPAVLEALVCVGGSEADIAEARRLAEALGVSPRVRFAGPVDDGDLPAVYRAAGCLVSAATHEGFGLPVAEAMAAGLPVVAARAGALPEVVAGGGLLFRPGDHAEAAMLIERVLSSGEERARLASAGRERAGALTWDRAARETAAVLREAVALGRTTRFARGVASLRALPRWVR